MARGTFYTVIDGEWHFWTDFRMFVFLSWLGISVCFCLMIFSVSLLNSNPHTNHLYTFIKTFSVCLLSRFTFRFYFPCGDFLFLALRSQHVTFVNHKYLGSNYEGPSPTGEIQAMWMMIGLCPSVTLHFDSHHCASPSRNCFVAV